MKTAALTFALAASLASAAHAHVTYNLSGYDAGLAGSTNGADGSPTSVPPASFTNGPVGDYAGTLPLNWYAGVHSNTDVRIVQTGLAPAPPSGSLLAQAVSFNDVNDPDLPIDRILAVGGLSWADPANGGQGWGHGLDYGVMHFTPLDLLLAGGPVKFTLTLADDPSDAAKVRLAFAIYGGWDTSATSSRHQTFVTDPSPVNDPLGSSGLVLLDYAVASAAGNPLSRTYDLDSTYDGQYTVLVGALDGVAGQYQVTVSTAVDAALGLCEEDLAATAGDLGSCQTDLATTAGDLGLCQDDLATATADADGDAAGDADDACPGTPEGEAVDPSGCSLAQFCGSFDVSTDHGKKTCKKADWSNDEPVLKKRDADCAFDRSQRLCVPAD
jgi:hypothetical protein